MKHTITEETKKNEWDAANLIDRATETIKRESKTKQNAHKRKQYKKSKWFNFLTIFFKLKLEIITLQSIQKHEKRN